MKHELRIYPNFNKLKSYAPKITNEQAIFLKERGLKVRMNYSDEENPFVALEELQINLEYTSKKEFNDLIDVFPDFLSRHKVAFEHYSELFYLIITENEELWHIYNLYNDFYEQDKKAKEIATFLLAYKTANQESPYQIVFRENIGTESQPVAKSASIKDKEIANWICELVYQNIASANFPLGSIGETIFSHLGINPFGKDTSIELEKLEKTSRLSLSSPKKYLRKSTKKLCENLLPFLREYTGLKNEPGVKLSSNQATFFYELLCILGYIPLDRKGVSNIDYMHGIFKAK